MIRKIFNNTSPEKLHAMLCYEVACTVVDPEETVLCDCKCDTECQESLPVFADPDAGEKRNDKSDFIFRVLGLLDSGTLELWKFENGVAVKKTQLNTNAFGTYFPLGTFTNCPGQEFYIGYLLEWETVFANYGTGQYYVRFDATILGVATERFSDIYLLEQYRDNLADETIVIHTVQNGKVKRSPFDYRGMNWQGQIRLPGFFGLRSPELVQDRYLDENYDTIQIQDELVDSYKLEINKFINGQICEDFIYNRLLATEVLVTDYNLCQTEEFCKLPIVIESFDNTYEDRYSAGRAYEITVQERRKDRFTRNVK